MTALWSCLSPSYSTYKVEVIIAPTSRGCDRIRGDQDWELVEQPAWTVQETLYYYCCCLAWPQPGHSEFSKQTPSRCSPSPSLEGLPWVPSLFPSLISPFKPSYPLGSSHSEGPCSHPWSVSSASRDHIFGSYVPLSLGFLSPALHVLELSSSIREQPTCPP